MAKPNPFPYTTASLGPSLDGLLVPRAGSVLPWPDVPPAPPAVPVTVLGTQCVLKKCFTEWLPVKVPLSHPLWFISWARRAGLLLEMPSIHTQSAFCSLTFIFN